MSSQDFLFAVRLSDEAPFDEMVGEVAACVFEHVGCGEPASHEIMALLHDAIAEGVTRGLHQCDVQFRVRGGDLQIAVTFGGGREWHTTYSIG